MIRLCTETDRKQVLEYLYQDAAYNIFPIGDIEAFGFDKSFQRVYGEFDESGALLSVFLRYREHAIYYADAPYFNEEYSAIFRDDPFDYISGKSETIALLKHHLANYKKKRMYFCEATSVISNLEYDCSIIHTVQSEDDCGRLYDLLSAIDEFSVGKKSKESFIEGKLNSLEMGTTLFIEEDGKIVSTVATTAETTINAMVVAVATDPSYRQKGYATILVTELMKQYFNDKHKTLCLFYDNPAAGAIYLRLGFKNIGTWDMFEKEV